MTAALARLGGWFLGVSLVVGELALFTRDVGRAALRLRVDRFEMW